MTFRLPRFVRLPPLEAAERSAALFERAKAGWTGPRLRRWWGRPVPGTGAVLLSAQALEVTAVRSEAAQAEAAAFYHAELGCSPPQGTLWTVRLGGQLVAAAPVQFWEDTALLWPGALTSDHGVLWAPSRGYVCHALISLRLWPPSPDVPPVPGRRPVALALSLPGSEDERSVQGAGFQPFPASPSPG